VTGARRGLPALAEALDLGTDVLEQAIGVLRAHAATHPAVAAGDPGGSADPAELPVGAADRLLLSIHEDALGRPFELSLGCDACGTLTTLVLTPDSVGEHWPRSAWCGPGVGVREPCYLDLVAARGDAAALLARCSIGTGATLDDLARIEGSLCGPLISVCVECGEPIFDNRDVVPLVLASLTSVGVELDYQVHVLAAAYGWDLTTIESLPDARRRRLVDLAARVVP
jgi:hypothetical protein